MPFEYRLRLTRLHSDCRFEYNNNNNNKKKKKKKKKNINNYNNNSISKRILHNLNACTIWLKNKLKCLDLKL